MDYSVCRWVESRRSRLTGSRIVILALASILCTTAGMSAAESRFQRGDANLDGAFDISDAIYTTRMLFLGEPSLGCDDAADVDDDGVLNITDCIYGVRFLFLDGMPPSMPFGECGLDPVEDALYCTAYPGCPDEPSLCLDQELLDTLLGPMPSFTLCLPAGIAALGTDTFLVSVCPAEGALPCGLTQLAGCPLEITSIRASVDVAGSRLVVRFEGRVDELPIQVTEMLFNTTTTCLTSIHGQAAADPFSFDVVVPLETRTIEPGMREITGVGEGVVGNQAVVLTASGNLICTLFQAGQSAFIGLIVTQVEALTNQVVGSLGAQVVGLRLCEGA
jgi:hypothetical protein